MHNKRVGRGYLADYHTCVCEGSDLHRERAQL